MCIAASMLSQSLNNHKGFGVASRQDGREKRTNVLNEPPENELPEKPRLKKGRILAVLLIILLDCALVFSLILFFPLLTGSTNRSVNSLDWSGYVVATNLNNPQPSVTAIEASWTVPEIGFSARDSFSAAWIGVGGQFDGDNTLIQMGTEQDSINGVGTYSAWYELLPENEVTIDSLSVSPGDRITASISLSDPSTNTWSLEIHDLNGGQSFQNSVIYASSMLSAEWIVERPRINNVLRNLADFSELTFTGCEATVGDKVETISSLPFIEVTLINQNAELTSVSPLASNGSSFTINYLANG